MVKRSKKLVVTRRGAISGSIAQKRFEISVSLFSLSLSLDIVIRRVLLIQALLVVVGVILFRTGLVTLPVAARPAVLILALAYGASVLFLGWKYVLQPRLNGFRFNNVQKQAAVQRKLASYPVFFDTAGEEFSWVAEFEEKAPEIIEEVRGFMAQGEGKEAEGFNTAYHNSVLSLSPTWKTLNLLSYGTVNSRLLPRTLEIVSGLPNVFTCNLSKLSANTEVRPHAGESTSYVRCHLGIDIPAPAPTTALHVAGQERSWAEGKVLAFCDGHWHGAHNRSDRDRYVLILDVMPPRLAWYRKQFCALMVALNVTQYLLPGRISLDEPLWRPPVLFGCLVFTTIGVPMVAGFYLYFRYVCRDRTPWMRRLAKAGFGFYY